MAREERQHYFNCSSCRWFGPLTKDELASIRVDELGSSPCPRCGQAGYLDPAMPRPSASKTTWVVVSIAAFIAAIAAALSR